MNSHYEKFLSTGAVKCIDSEIPFDIPSGWEWVRLGSIYNHCSGKALNESNREGTLKPYITTSNLYWDHFELDNLKKMYFTDEELDKCTVVKGDLLVCEGGDVGRSAIWNFDEPICIQNHIHKLRSYIPLSTLFYFYVLFLYKNTGFIGGKGIGIQGLSSQALHRIIVPLPSCEEQMRIVNEIEELMPIIKKYEHSQNELDKLNNDIKDKLRKSILQEAIQGKLVPQDPTEGTAEELLLQIKAEKVKLVKEGKLKKHALVDNTIFKGDDNRYYEQIGKETASIETDWDFPSNWQIARLSNVCALIDGEKRAGKRICIDAKYLRGKSVGDYINEGRFVQKNDQIILVDGENSGEVFTVPCDGYMGSTFKQLWVSEQMSLQYVLYFISFYKDLLRNSKKGAAIPHLNKEIFYTLVIGIPPKKEQERIVNRIDQLLQLLK